MKGPDRDEATHYVKYLQTGPETIDFVHGVDESTVDYRGIVTLKELGTENTELNFRMVFDSPQTKADNHGAPQGLANTLSRLEALLTDPTATDKESM